MFQLLKEVDGKGIIIKIMSSLFYFKYFNLNVSLRLFKIEKRYWKAYSRKKNKSENYNKINITIIIC